MNEILYTLYNSLLIKFYITIATLKINKKKNKIKALHVLQEIKDSINIDIDIYTYRLINNRLINNRQ